MLLPVFTCILALSATYFGSFARRALVRSRTPMIMCLSNARSEDLHFGISFVALRALVREIIPNTIHTSDVNRKPKFWLSDKKPKPIWFLVFQLKFSWYFVGFKILTNFFTFYPFIHTQSTTPSTYFIQ